MREISLDRLRTLVAIADLGSFAEAARVLHLAPPTVSLHIADLESRVGGKLLSRTRGRIQPSAIGETLVERARRLLADAEQALEDVERQVGARQGSCRVFHAASNGLSTAGKLSATMASRSGLRVTGPSGDQSRVAPDQRAGLASRARMYSAWRAAKMA